MFITAIVTVMKHYPITIIEQVVDPFCGLPSRQNRLPTPYDVRKMCDELMEPQRRELRWERQSEAQVRDRSEPDRAKRYTIEEIGDEMAARGIFLPSWVARNRHLLGVDGRPHKETPSTVRAKLGLTEAEWDRLPDTK